MINWIIGGIIAALTVCIIVRMVISTKNGKCSCCESCHEKHCGYNGK